MEERLEQLNEIVMQVLRGQTMVGADQSLKMSLALEQQTGLAQHQCWRLLFWGSRKDIGYVQTVMYNHALMSCKR